MRLQHLPANLLTLARIPLGALVWLDAGNRTFFVVILAVGGLTDVIDGALARWLDKGSRTDPKNVGAWLDPLCDKLFAASCVGAAFVAYAPPGWVMALLLVREMLQAPLVLAYVLSWRPRGIHVDFRAVPAGKLTTVLQTLALAALLYAPRALPFLAPLVAITGALSVVIVARRAWRDRNA